MRYRTHADGPVLAGPPALTLASDGPVVRYFTRLAPVVFRALRNADGANISRIHERVRLHEIDLNVHMNQAVYPKVFELGRTDWMLRSTHYKRWRASELTPVVAEQRIIYRRELKPLVRYVVDTRAVAIEGRLLAYDQHILVGDTVHAKCECKLIFISPNGVLSPEGLVPHAEGVLAEPLPVVDWKASDPSVTGA